MKKILLLISIIGIFCLAGCDTIPADDAKTESNSTETTNNIETSNVNDNTNQQSNDEPSKTNENDTSESKDDETSLPDYEDDTEWKGTVF